MISAAIYALSAQLDTLPRPVIYTGSDTYTYSSGKDLIASIDNGRSVITYTHDANGNITADGMYSYSFNANNQLIKVTNGSVRGEYVYNVKGQRVKKAGSGKTTIYHYDLQEI